MGDIMKEDDIYIASLLDLLNLRFAPVAEPSWNGGLAEMVALQKEFEIFQEGRSFADSAALLNAGGFWNERVKSRWYKLLAVVGKAPSNRPDEDGSTAIVRALIYDLAARKPRPVFFKAHDAREDKRVLIDAEDTTRPIFYIAQDYLTISLPMKPKSQPRASRATAKRK